MARCQVHGEHPDPTCHICHVGARMAQYAAEGRVELAQSVLVDMYEEEVERLLDALGHPEALVTDLSAISDFLGSDVDQCRKLGQRLGVSVSLDDLVVAVAKRLREL